VPRSDSPAQCRINFLLGKGLLAEKGYAGGGVFVEEDVPFTVLVRPNSASISLQWCELPTFVVEVTDGDVTYRLLRRYGQ
jgi:hypothetical protein